MLTGQQGSAIFIALMAGFFWISEFLRWTIYEGKVPGSYMPDWMSVLWILCILGIPIISLFMAVLVYFDPRERVTTRFLSFVAFGVTPILSLVGYMLILR